MFVPDRKTELLAQYSETLGRYTTLYRQHECDLGKVPQPQTEHLTNEMLGCLTRLYTLREEINGISNTPRTDRQ